MVPDESNNKYLTLIGNAHVSQASNNPGQACKEQLRVSKAHADSSINAHTRISMNNENYYYEDE